jgi:DNA-binding response OmpR family regulator
VLEATVLLVEDSKMQKIANERLLTHAGFTVLCAMDGEQALAVAREKLPDLILLDMLLPRMSGLQVLRHSGSSLEQPAFRSLS